MPARLTNSTWVAPSSSAGWKPDSHPLRLPMGVRTASTITARAIAYLPRARVRPGAL